MGNIVMPKQSADKAEMEAVLSVYVKHNNWLENSTLIAELKDIIGHSLENQAYTKKVQIPAYFGFIEWENPTKKTSKKRITERGKRFYDALISNKQSDINEEIIKAFEELNFGRDVHGCSSDSEIEPPKVFIKASLFLDYLTRKEYGYILWKMDEYEMNLLDLMSEVKTKRSKNNNNYNGIPPKFNDAKPITALYNWGFLESNGKINGQERIKINQHSISTNLERLLNLKVKNNSNNKKISEIDKKEQFKNWLDLIDKYEKSNKSKSYIRAIDILETEFNINIYKEANTNILTELYQDLILNQKDSNGKYSYEKAKSYGGKGFYSAAIKAYLLFLDQDVVTKPEIDQEEFDSKSFQQTCNLSGLTYKPELIARYIASLTTKPFVLLSGLSGSGKTKLAEAYAKWICESEAQYALIPVGADWTNREPLLGYVNALDNDEYILPENGALKLLIEANKEENQNKPYFLILDEMNLSHVERYFADFLSVMESKNEFKLHSSEENLNKKDKFKNSPEVPNALTWPKNLYVIGTVNIDETTYMFSPKVLDRANVIEFRVSDTDLNDYFESEIPLNMEMLLDEETKIGLGAQFGKGFVLKSNEEIDKAAKKARNKNLEKLNKELKAFFIALQAVGAEFGYRTASEIQTLFGQIESINPNLKDIDLFSDVYPITDNFKIDVAIMQKLLPKLHGSRNKLVDVLKVLANLCLEEKIEDDKKEKIFDIIKKEKRKIIYPISLNKITRMYNNVIANGFTSYAEA
jgi:hypothetical protein